MTKEASGANDADVQLVKQIGTKSTRGNDTFCIEGGLYQPEKK